MENKVGWTIKQAAQALKVSEMTVRRRIRAGTLPAKQVPGKYGDEWLITELPGELTENSRLDETSGGSTFAPPEDLLAMINELRQENRDLALSLGEYRAKAEYFEAQVLQLQAPKKPWYKRLFR